MQGDIDLMRSRLRLADPCLDMLLDDRLLEELMDLDRHELAERDGLEPPEDGVLGLLILALSSLFRYDS